MTEQYHVPGPGDPKYGVPGGTIDPGDALDDAEFARLDPAQDQLDNTVTEHDPKRYAEEGRGEVRPVGTEEALVKSRGQWNQALRRFYHDKTAMAGLIVFVALSGFALVNTALNPNGYTNLTTDYLVAPSWKHPFGTTTIGVDLFQACMRGLIVDLQVAFIVAAVSTIIGIGVGAAAGFFGGKIDAVLMQLVNLILMVPTLVVLIVLSNTVRNSSDSTVLLALLVAALSWTYMSRLVRAEFLSLRKRDFIEAARAIGASPQRIIFRHMLPNAMGPIAVNTTLTMAGAVLLESTLSFLGLGIQPPDVSLGHLLFDGQSYATVDWWVFAFPAAILLLLILSIFVVGDGLQAAVDPRKSRNR